MTYTLGVSKILRYFLKKTHFGLSQNYGIRSSGLEVYILVHALGDFRCVQHARVSVWSGGDHMVLGDRSSLGEMKIHHPLPPRTRNYTKMHDIYDC